MDTEKGANTDADRVADAGIGFPGMGISVDIVS